MFRTVVAHCCRFRSLRSGVAARRATSIALRRSIGVSIDRSIGPKLGTFGHLRGASKAANPMD